MKPLRVGVVGVGHIGKNHARVYAESEISELTAILDQNGDAAKKLAAKFGCVAVETLEEFVELVDAASIATPTPFHYPIGKQLLLAKKHLLIEKPITENVEHAYELADLAQSNGVVLQVGHIERFNPVLGELEKHLTRAQFIEAHRLSPYPDRSTEIGVVLDLMIHDIEVILHLVRSEVTHVDSVGISVLSAREDIANARIRFANGCVANITASRISPEKMRKIRVFQENAYLSLDYGNQSGEIYRLDNGKISRDKVKIDKAEPLKRELESFIQCSREGANPTVSGYQAAAALELSLEITRQIEQQNAARNIG